MSTDPRPIDHEAGTTSEAAGAPGGDPAAEPTHRADAPPAAAVRMRGSGLVARLLTVVYALIVTPIATGLLSYGGSGWLQYFMTRRFMDSSPVELLGTPMGSRILLGVGLGLLLLASVVATGIASSAGLLAVGVLGLVSIVLSIVPALMLEVYMTAAEVIPPQFLDGMVYGLPLILHPLMGGLGLGLLVARRRPDPHVAASVAGLVVVPLMLLLGAGLLFRGVAEGAAFAMRMFRLDVQPMVVVLVLAGALLVTLGGAASRWSPYALIVPALVTLVASLAMMSSDVLSLISGLWNSPTASSAVSFLLVGGGLAAAVVMLVHTVVLAIVRHRARRQARALAS